MFDLPRKNYALSQLFGTIYYVSLVTLALLVLLEFVKNGFVSFHFNLVWLLILVLVSGSVYAIFRVGQKPNGIFSNIVFLISLFALFFIIGARVEVDFINPYLLGLIIIINLGLAFYILRPSRRSE
ncbi:hypothetical protein KJ969_03945 [Patescibacteria group bacterium]|nr:hypothetical protein [Patescibacteria group bacterium]MBU1921817.1 hypothetical protein [Patescibacteria group bacterium]